MAIGLYFHLRSLRGIGVGKNQRLADTSLQAQRISGIGVVVPRHQEEGGDEAAIMAMITADSSHGRSG